MGDNSKTRYSNCNSVEILGVFPDYKLYGTNDIDTFNNENNYELKANDYFELIKGECILEYLKLRGKFNPKRILDYNTIPHQYHNTLTKMINSYLAIV